VGEVDEDLGKLRRRLWTSFDVDGEGHGFDDCLDRDGLYLALDDVDRAEARRVGAALLPGSVPATAGTPFRDAPTGRDRGARAAPAALDDPAWRPGAAALARYQGIGLWPGAVQSPRSASRCACASAYFPLPAASVVFIVVGVVGAIFCVALLARRAHLNAPPM